MIERTPDYSPESHDWFLHFNLDFLVEIPTQVVRAFLPPDVHPVEPRPEVSLISVALLDFDAGNLGYLPAFSETSCSVVVRPDLSTGVLPRFAFYVVNIASTCEPFLRWAHHRDKMPVYRGQGLEIHLDPDRLAGGVRDAEGPVFELANTHPAPSFEEDLIEVQTHNDCHGERWLAKVMWAGYQFQHQKRGCTVRLHKHPFFRGLVPETGDYPCFLQMMTPARTAAVMRYEAPVRVG